jgi:hypothetical protein
VLEGSGELLLQGRQPGSTLLLLYAEGAFAVWRLEVGGSSRGRPVPEEPLQRARAACPGLTTTPARLTPQDETRRLVAPVADERCRSALVRLLETDAFWARELELTFQVPALQGQLVALEAALAKKGLKTVSARYLGAGLVLSGQVSTPEKRRVLWETFRQVAGRVALEDRLVVPPADTEAPERP